MRDLTPVDRAFSAQSSTGSRPCAKSAAVTGTTTCGAMPTSSITWLSAVYSIQRETVYAHPLARGNVPGFPVEPAVRSPMSVRCGNEALVAARALLADQEKHGAGVLPCAARIEQARHRGPEVRMRGTVPELHVAGVDRGGRETRGNVEGKRIGATAVHPHVENQRWRKAEALERGIEIGGADAGRVPPADVDVRHAIQDAVAPVTLSRRPICPCDVLLPHRPIPIDEGLGSVGRQGPAGGISHDHVPVVKAPEHLANHADEAELIRRGNRPGTKRGAERIPVDLLVLEVRVLTVERAPEGIELSGEVRGRRGGRSR
jgi:hypothetical protein